MPRSLPHHTRLRPASAVRRPSCPAGRGLPAAPVLSGPPMDYCAPCHRTLNGAVTCPECGAYDSAMTPTGEIPVAAAAMPEIRPEEETAPGEAPAAARDTAHTATAPVLAAGAVT
ncbi:hypothetical protein ABTX79_30520, partial [Streptomyces sp. NPDC096153]